MDNNKTALQFPCYFPIKIIGKNSPTFQEEITKIVLEHFPGVPETTITCRNSNENNFISITATVFVHEQIALDRLYQELTKHPDVKMVL